MPQTPIYGLEFEAPSDLPGRTLTGENSSPILAEQVETELDRIDGDVAAVQTDVNDLTTRGWHDITPAGGTVINAATVFNVDSGLFDMIRVYLRGSMTATGLISLRVNNDATADLHRRNRIVWSQNSGAVDDNNASEGTQWFLAAWGVNVNNVAWATIYATDGTNVLSFEGGGYRNSATAANRRKTLSDGGLTSSRLLDSIQVLGSAGADIDSVRVWIEGHRA